MTSVPTRLRALVDACHPGPTATVSVVVAALSAAAGRDPLGVALMGLATLTGQLSVGWCNDANDADRDVRAGRAGKPLVRGDVTARTLWVAAAAALTATVALSYVAAGPVGGSAHVVAVLSAWTYNLLLKTTVLSALPYAVSFGLVPAFVTYGLTPPVAPASWLVAACVLLGVGAHLANAIPDVTSDERVDAGGLVVAIGVRRASEIALVCVVGALALLALHLDLAPWMSVGLVLVVSAGAVVVAVRGEGSALFRYVLVVAVLAVLLLLLASRSLTA
ncbi:MAG TPA: UbiA family prenyltransferase [Candidatus Nanopelagicales bacterium]|jgi:4-hydroxybenzoate polyprenyltransferase